MDEIKGADEYRSQKGGSGEDRPSITVGGKRILEYVFDCAAQFNRGADEVVLQSVKQSISKATEVSQILTRHLGVNVLPTSVRQLTKEGMHFTHTETVLRCEDSFREKGDYTLDPEADYLEFPLYHLLLDLLLHRNSKLTIGNYEQGADTDAKDSGHSQRNALLTIVESERGFRCIPDQDLLQVIAKKTEGQRERQQGTLARLVAVFGRCGLLLSPRWDEVCQKLAESDDVVLGVDTNILYECIITQQLLDGFVFSSASDYLHTPNWALVVIPSAVMHEIEQIANSRTRGGRLSFQGRMGYRALQEIMELDQSKDLTGVSLLIAGETNPILDMRVELRGLREDMRYSARGAGQAHFFSKMSAGDTVIRDQFKTFLRQIGFHKGAFFVTADKSNAVLAQTEGLNSLYYQTPPWSSLLMQGETVEPPRVDFDGEGVTLSIPLGKLIYELTVEFGEIWIAYDDSEISLECDSKGESLDHWVNRDLRIAGKDLKKLVANYKDHGRFPLTKVSNIWKELGRDLMGWF
jgi:DNA-binding protein Alba